jgi:outer membrane protein TolC
MRVLIIRIFWLLIIGCIGFPFSSRAQLTDTVPYSLSEQELLAIIRKFHPYLQQANLQVDQAGAFIRESRGAFDPILSTSFDKKTFDEQLYYNYFNPEIAIPTWYGIELYGGLEEVIGTRTANERSLGKTSYLGISVPLAKDLVLDKRRAVLQQAKIMLNQTAAERQNLINDLLNESLAVYWTWVRNYQVYRILNDAVQVNAERYRFIRLEAEQGLRAAIDTTEALTQLQQFQLLEADAWLQFQNAGLDLSNFLWQSENRSFEWSDRIIPDSNWTTINDWNLDLPSLDELVTSARLEHPKLKAYEFKLGVQEIERRLKFQSLLPKADLKYNLLNKGYNVVDKLDRAFLENNYKIGFSFQMPLFLRQGRGAYQQAQIKIRQTNLDIDQLQLEIENKVRNYYNELMTLRKQISINENAYANYMRLFRGESLRFNVGESTLFLLNARENKVLESLQKLIELKTKWYKSKAALVWAGGRWGQLPYTSSSE